jgi:protein TonB
MKNGRSMKASLAVSVLAHAVLVGALFMIGSAVTGTKEVFFVELKSISVTPASGRTVKAAPAKKPKAPPLKKIAKPEKKNPVEDVKEPVVVEQEPAEVSDAPVKYVVEAPEEESAVEAAAQEVASSSSDTGEEFAPSSGPNSSSNELLRRIRQAIQRELTYPSLARKRRLEGTVVAGFTIDARGGPHEIEIVASSGFKVLDKEVVKIIRRAAPYPYIPERVEVPVSFRLVTERP